MPATTTVEQTGVKSVHIRSGGYQKERVTVMLACTATGEKLKPWVFFKRKTVPKGNFPNVKDMQELQALQRETVAERELFVGAEVEEGATAPRLPPLAASAPPLAARSPPLAARSPPLAARAPPSGSPLAAPFSPLTALWQPAHRPLQPARRPLAARSPPFLLAALPCPAHFPSARTPPYLRAALLVAHHPALPAMATLCVLTFDHEGPSLAPPDTTDSATRSQWLNRDAAARLAVCNHLPLAERAHFGQHKTAKAVYDAVVARYSSPATAALGRLILPYLFPELSAFATIEDLVTHLCTSNALYRSALLAEDHFLALDPTDLTVDLLEKGLLEAETSVVAVGAARGTPCTPFFEGCSPSPLAPSYASAAAVDILGAEDVGAASALSGKRRSNKGKGGKSGGGGCGGGGGVGSGGGRGGGGGGSGGSGGGSGGFGGGGGGSGGGGGGGGGSGGSGGGGSGGGRGGAVQRGGSGGGQRQHQRGRSETPTPQQLREWFAQRGASGELLRSGVDIFALDYDAILAAMYALSVSAEGDCYPCVPPDPGIEAAALGASESALPGTAPAKALHTFTLDSGASRCFFRDSTTLTPLPAPVPVRQADPSRGPVLARSSTVLSCRHLATFTRRPGSGLYTMTAEPPQVAAFAQVSASGTVVAPCSCRLLLHRTLLWHHRLVHPSLPRLRGMHSRLLVSGLPWCLPPLPPSPAPPCLPCVEGQQRAAPHSSSFPPTTTPLQTLHMDVWGPTHVSGHGLRLQLREQFCEDLPVLRLHFDRGGEFSSDLLRDFCRGEGILLPFTLPASPQKNGIAERHIGLVIKVARTSMIHAPAPHFLWPIAVRYAAHQLNLWPRVSLPETSPTLRWTWKVGDVSVFRGPALSCVSQVDPLPGTVPVEVAVDSGATRSAASRGAASWGAEPPSAEPGGAEP
ncbi:unnamed protein product [Closterium sp. NIES-54]